MGAWEWEENLHVPIESPFRNKHYSSSSPGSSCQLCFKKFLMKLKVCLNTPKPFGLQSSVFPYVLMKQLMERSTNWTKAPTNVKQSLRWKVQRGIFLETHQMNRIWKEDKFERLLGHWFAIDHMHLCYFYGDGKKGPSSRSKTPRPCSWLLLLVLKHFGLTSIEMPLVQRIPLQTICSPRNDVSWNCR